MTQVIQVHEIIQKSKKRTLQKSNQNITEKQARRNLQTNNNKNITEKCTKQRKLQTYKQKT